MSSTAPARIWSALQERIFAVALTTWLHLVVRARAGTGKTTTIVELVKRILAAHPSRVVTVAAFNKDIATELQTRFAGYPVIVKTLHAIGLACIKRYWSHVNINFSKDRVNTLAQRVAPKAPDTIQAIIAKLLTPARDIAPHATHAAELYEIAERFECVPDDEWIAEGFGLDYVCARVVEAMEIACAEQPATGIDGADMIFIPVRNRWYTKNTDDILIDEAQDMNAAQLELARGITRQRVIVVGDDRQGIYSFRGADTNSIDRLKAELGATELTLNVTYRCAQAIVREAQRFVPDFTAGPNNPEGAISNITRSQIVASAQPGNFVLSRTNAPLVAVAMSLLRAGKRCRVAGKDIGNGLCALVRKLKARSVPELLTKLDAHERRELARLEARYVGRLTSDTYIAKCDAIRDQVSMLVSLSDSARNVDDITSRVDALFTDDGLGQAGMITCSSVHKSKGLEADRVFVLADTLRDHTTEERNICYVAITRAKSELIYVHKDPVEGR